MAKKINISFKETKRDIALYEAIMALDDKSYVLKQILYKVLIAPPSEPKQEIKAINDINLDLLDI